MRLKIVPVPFYLPSRGGCLKFLCQEYCPCSSCLIVLLMWGCHLVSRTLGSCYYRPFTLVGNGIAHLWGTFRSPSKSSLAELAVIILAKRINNILPFSEGETYIPVSSVLHAKLTLSACVMLFVALSCSRYTWNTWDVRPGLIITAPRGTDRTVRWNWRSSWLVIRPSPS